MFITFFPEAIKYEQVPQPCFCLLKALNKENNTLLRESFEEGTSVLQET